MNKLQIIQNKALRQIHSINWYDFIKNIDIHNILNIRQTTETLYYRFTKIHNKTQEINKHTFNKINRDLGNKTNRLQELLDNPPQNILQN